jgi:hypothetical protein
MTLQLVYANTNEDGYIYDSWPDLRPALARLEEYPNDSIVITYVDDVWRQNYLEMPQWWGDPTVPRCDVCGVHHEEAEWCGECGNCGQHCEC